MSDEPNEFSLSEAVASGNKRAQLEALLGILARAIDTCDSMRDLAALSNRIQSVIAEIDNLPSETKKSKAAESTGTSKSKRARATKPSAGDS